MIKTTLHLAKQNFKFSCGHFLIFNSHEAEKLHGHNYQVKVDLVCPYSEENKKQGYFQDFNIFKKIIKARLDEWDEHVLLPELHPDMKFQSSADQKNYEIRFRDRFYSLPKNEVIWLKVANTSVEEFSRLLCIDLMKAFVSYQVQQLQVTVEETRGQMGSATMTAADLSGI